MKKNIYFLLAHQDDEIGILESIIKENKKNKIFVIYLTSGGKNKKEMYIRNNESLEGLSKLGVKRNNIFFINHFINLKQMKLVYKINKVKFILQKKFFTKNFPDKIYSHSWEGGHPDHDAAFLISYFFFKQFKINFFSFPMYNCENLKWPLYKAFVPIKKNGTNIIKKYSYKNFYKYLKCLLSYKSQKNIWIGLYPFLILRIFIFQKYYLQKPYKFKNIKKPHENTLMYEQRGMMTWKSFLSQIKTFNLL